MSTIVLALSFVLQFSAAIGAFRLIKLTVHLWAWSLIAPALTLMGVRRSITFTGLSPVAFRKRPN